MSRPSGKEGNLREVRRHALWAACMAVCVFCKEGIPYDEDRGQHENMYHCKAKTIRYLFTAGHPLELK